MKRLFFVFLLPLAIFFLFGIFYFWPQPMVFWLAIFLIFSILLLSFWKIFLPFFNRSFLFFVQIFVFTLVISFLPIFIGQSILFLLCLACLCLLLYLYFRSAYQLFYQPRLYRAYSLETMALPLNFVIIFLLVAEVEILVLIYHLPYLIAVLALFLFFSWLNFYFFNLKAPTIVWPFSFLVGLLLTEFYLAISRLPLSGHLNGLILGLVFVMIIKIWQKREQQFLLVKP